MKSIKCSLCGGQMYLDVSGMTAFCPYCKSKYLLDHEDTDYYRNFFAQMNSFLNAPKDEQERKQQADLLWENAYLHTFICKDGTPIEIKYMHTYTEDDVTVYVARRNIAFHFHKDGIEKSELFRKNISALDFPSADIRNLEEYFPKISGGFELTDGTFLCVIAKKDDEYPLRLFGKLPGRHVAWVVSRLENLCCVLEFSSLVHPQITPDTIYINPYTHQASLYGNWWNAGKHNSFTRDNKGILQLKQNLTGLRETAALTLGYFDRRLITKTPDIPPAFATFLRSEPCQTAYDDFAYWDDMLIKSYGERKFMTLDTNDEKIYGKEE